MLIDHILSDRGETFTLVCIAVTFGIVCGFFIIPALILSLFAAQVVYTAVSLIFAESFALLIGLSVYYAGAFLACVVAPVIHDALFQPVTYAVNVVCNAATSAYNGFWSLLGYNTASAA